MGNKIKLTLNHHSPINSYLISFRGFPHFSLRSVSVSCLTLPHALQEPYHLQVQSLPHTQVLRPENKCISS